MALPKITKSESSGALKESAYILTESQSTVDIYIFIGIVWDLQITSQNWIKSQTLNKYLLNKSKCILSEAYHPILLFLGIVV